MDLLMGVLIIAAMIFVLARPFRPRSEREADIYRRVSGLDGEASEERQPCPHCGEKILATASVCRFCGQPVNHQEG